MKTIERISIACVAIFMMWFIITMSFVMGTYKGHRDALEIVKGGELPNSSPIKSIWYEHIK